MSPCPRNVPSTPLSPNSPCARHHDFTFMNTCEQRPPFVTHVIVVVQSLCLTLCDPMDCSTPGFPVLHYLLELAETHVHWVSDAMQPSPPLSLPSPSARNRSQYQSLFQWVSSSHQVAKVLATSASVLPANIQGWFPLVLTGLIITSGTPSISCKSPLLTRRMLLLCHIEANS